MGFDFQIKPTHNLLPTFDSFELFSGGRSKKIKNLLTNSEELTAFHIFRYSYTSGTGKNSHHRSQTVFSFSSKDCHFPAFDLGPEYFYHKIGSAFGYQDIDFESHPEFSCNYLLRGSDEQAIRSFFNHDLLSYFGKNKGLTFEVRGDRVIFYTFNERIRTEDIEAFYRLSNDIYKTLCDGLK